MIPGLFDLKLPYLRSVSCLEGIMILLFTHKGWNQRLLSYFRHRLTHQVESQPLDQTTIPYFITFVSYLFYLFFYRFAPFIHIILIAVIYFMFLSILVAILIALYFYLFILSSELLIHWFYLLFWPLLGRRSCLAYAACWVIYHIYCEVKLNKGRQSQELRILKFMQETLDTARLKITNYISKVIESEFGLFDGFEIQNTDPQEGHPKLNDQSQRFVRWMNFLRHLSGCFILYFLSKFELFYLAAGLDWDLEKKPDYFPAFYASRIIEMPVSHAFKFATSKILIIVYKAPELCDD